MKIRIIAFSAAGCSLGHRVAAILGNEDCEEYAKTDSAPENMKKAENLGTWTKESMEICDAIIFIGATGIAVRAIAPYVKDKKKDPAVVCIDDAGRFVISLLSGHIGGANRLAARIAEGIGGTPVITTATDIHGKFAVDVFAEDNGMVFRGTAAAKNISSRVIDGRKVFFTSEFPWTGKIPEEITQGDSGDAGISVSAKANPPKPYGETLVLIPKIHCVGIGCRKGADPESVRQLFEDVLRENDIDVKSVKLIASIDLKKDEKAIIDLASRIGVPAVFFTSEELNDQENIGFSSSDFVKSVTSVDCVCERAAVKASKGGKLICGKTARNGATAAIAAEDFTIGFGDTR